MEISQPIVLLTLGLLFLYGVLVMIVRYKMTADDHRQEAMAQYTRATGEKRPRKAAGRHAAGRAHEGIAELMDMFDESQTPTQPIPVIQQPYSAPAPVSAPAPAVAKVEIEVTVKTDQGSSAPAPAQVNYRGGR